jgi:hypothetical protein
LDDISLIDENRIIFVMDLMNPRLNGIWECYTFREFLGEKFTKEELFFYLHCRYLLLEGRSQDRPGYRFDVILYVRLEHAKNVVIKILQNFDSSNI